MVLARHMQAQYTGLYFLSQWYDMGQGYQMLCFLLFCIMAVSSQQSAPTATLTSYYFWKSNGNHTFIATWYSQLIQPDRAGKTTVSKRKAFSPSCRTHWVTNASKSQVSSGLLLKVSPSPAWLQPGDPSPGTAHLPLPSQGLGREVWFSQALT